ncbi:Membrane protein insertase YidC [Mesoplasma sp. JKS002658]|uniref:membrane protein insertase YidC n=1 Tax=Mesoplasma whartonense TaxID=2878854 RepID=UPI002022A2FC|nr:MULTISPECIES: membrane protein insertase YidC [unclassified Mesoplasma]MCL8211626.1 Membrane protein insertase YidC [Mesoplasma sp. JKS002664]MCL8212365.1 Membrane protein insertase YidC [Mesoplasma sp. JKS002662]MCL8212794.1 Membrane protein insertase YidC [Mesoplasma sp. JKS002661]MCL8213513.1 Membrane protein insertase YidC [Mesoplasma sp. JKS002660]MCL8214390.1 Membrane protein insertase YidC [Mesoplasma sp. JKS002658]
MYKQNKGGTNSRVLDYFNPKQSNEPKSKRVRRQIWKWTKIIGFLFVLISMVWGCAQMYQSDYMVSQVTDMTGAKIFAPGTAFEIIIRSLGESGGRIHMPHGDISDFGEYGYNSITSWGQAFTVTKSPFYGFFVYPIAFILVGLVKGFSGTLEPGLDAHSQRIFGVSVFFAMFFTVLIIRLITLLFSWKAQKNQDKMQDMQIKQAEIQAKYKGKKDQVSRQKMTMETQALYKKEGISPLSSVGMGLAPLPFLFAIYAVIRSTRVLKIANIGAISLIEQPWHQVTHGQPIYLALLAVYLPLQIVSMLLPTFLQYRRQKGTALSEAQKKARRRNLIIQLVMIVVFIFVVASIASGVAIYWIMSSSFQICQTLGFHWYNQHKRQKGSQERERRLRQERKQKAKIASK